MKLPADSHVHSEWSWDTGGPTSVAAGRMRATCVQAIRIGLPALTFTEHLDFPGTWRSRSEDLMSHQRGFLSSAGGVEHPLFDADGYFEAIDRLRPEFPELDIRTGVEFGQPHLFADDAAALTDLAALDLVLGSLHTLDMGSGLRAEPVTLYAEHPASDVMWAYLEEVPRMVDGSDSFAVFTHIDYAARTWPSWEVGPFEPRVFEEGFRGAMRSIAASGRALEMNTGRLWSWIPQWWAEEGGRAVTFGSDAHTPDAVARNFPEATAMLEHYGFRAGANSWDLWTR
ncbi:PHP domain-containing protein [Microbacterium sp. A93]|uniref:PHP domain-containing protein n=1 Tax=Microbacterium sp. A93 TaxID=3450716 RepID=UPI003F439ABD